jgi:uncharacterized protein YbaR (Trm112 family)
MFIELTDHLRCPFDHDEQFLVLLPDRMDGRSVRSGQLGCPVCGRVFRVEDGVFDVGGAPPLGDKGSVLSVEAMAALVGLHGPGGYLVLAGEPAALAREVADQFPGVALVAVNPPAGLADGDLVSVVRGSSIPLKSRSMRGVILGPTFGGDPHWVREAARVVLPGLRVVGEGLDPTIEQVEVMASAGGAWVATPRR